MFKNTITPKTKEEVLSMKGTRDWDLYWKHIYNVMLKEERLNAEIKEKKELAKKKTKR